MSGSGLVKKLLVIVLRPILVLISALTDEQFKKEANQRLKE